MRPGGGNAAFRRALREENERGIDVFKAALPAGKWRQGEFCSGGIFMALPLSGLLRRRFLLSIIAKITGRRKYSACFMPELRRGIALAAKCKQSEETRAGHLSRQQAEAKGAK